MLEALTESFCERCGTRYEFAAPTRLGTFRKTRGLISGLRNYIMSQDALGDAVGDAMRSEEETLASRQLEAFHESFNFCIQCRQYACVNCWNEPAGRCRTCVPIPGTDDLIERFEASFHAQHPAAADETEMDAADINRRLGVEAWPTADLGASGDGHLDLPWPDAEPMAQPALTTEIPAEPAAAELAQMVRELEAAAPAAPERQPEPVIPEPERQPTISEPEWDPIAASTEVEPSAEPMLPALEGEIMLRWEGDASFELELEPVAEPEPEPVFEAEPEPEPVFEAEPEPQPVFEAEPEPQPVFEAEPEPEPVFEAEPEPEPVFLEPRRIPPISETILHIPTHRPSEPMPEPLAAEADDPALAARRAQLDLLGLGDPGEGPVTRERTNVLPYRSSGASVHPAELAARGDAHGAAQAAGSFWEASAREVAGVMTHIGVQNCGQCGLSLSASARFCRRCGTSQARSA
jgi:hypothetical protein